MKAARETHATYKARFQAMLAALPAEGAEREVCTAVVPAEGMMSMNIMHLEWALGLTPVGETESWDRNRFDTNVQHDLRAGFVPDPNEAPSPGAIMNLENSAAALAKLGHVVIFRPTTIDKGEVAGKMEDGSFEIKRPAVWKGWAFAFTFEDAPKLVAALPIEATSRDKMTVATRAGVPSSEVLINDVAMTLREPTLSRLAKAGCR